MSVFSRVALALSIVSTAIVACADDAQPQQRHGCLEGEPAACMCGDGTQRITTCIGPGLVGACPCDRPPVTSSASTGSNDSGSPTWPGLAGAAGAGAVVSTPVSARTLCAALFLSRSSELDRCCSSDDRDTLRYGKLVSSNWSREQSRCIEALEESVRSNAARIDQVRAAACVAKRKALIEGQSCADIARGDKSAFGDDDCRQSVVGLREEGKYCEAPHECVGAFTCVGYGQYATGTCRAPSSGAMCGYEVKSNATSPWTPLGLAFGSHPSCLQGEACDYGHAFSHCKSVAAEGERCLHAGECSEGSDCVGASSAGDDKVCTSKRGGIGAPCFGAPGNCEEGLYCRFVEGATATCLPLKKSGEPCEVPGEQDGCEGVCGPAPSGQGGVCKSFCGAGG